MNLRQQAFLFSLLIIPLASWAQDDLFTTVSAPLENTDSPFKTVSTPAAAPVEKNVAPVETQPLPAAKPVVKAVSKSANSEKWEQELLRDPFWPVGFFPEGWQKKTATSGDADLDGLGWKAAAGNLRISGTSRLGGRTAAIVNGELKGAGDTVEVVYEGKTYQWQIVDINASGQVQLKKLGIN